MKQNISYFDKYKHTFDNTSKDLRSDLSYTQEEDTKTIYNQPKVGKIKYNDLEMQNDELTYEIDKLRRENKNQTHKLRDLLNIV